MLGTNTWKSLHVTLNLRTHVKNCDWFLGRLREIGLFENVVLDSLRTIKLQICPDRRGLYALSHGVMYIKPCAIRKLRCTAF